MLLPSPSAANAAAAGASHNNFAAEAETTGCAHAEPTTSSDDIDVTQAETTTDNDDVDMGSILGETFLPEPTYKHYDMVRSILVGGSPEATGSNRFSPGTMTNNNDIMAGSSVLAGFSPAIVSSTPSFFVRPTFLQTLSLVSEKEEEKGEGEEPGVLLSRVGSSSSSALSKGFAFPPSATSASAAAAVIEDVSNVADGNTRGEEPELVEYEDGHECESEDARSGGSSSVDDDDGLLVQSCEEEGEEGKEKEEEGEEDEKVGGDDDDDEGEQEDGGREVDNSTLLPAPAVVAPAEDERSSMTNRLIRVLRSLQDRHVAVRGEYLARYCSLSRCEDNVDLTWLDIVGQGKFGRVSLVQHELGRYAVKELTEVSIALSLYFVFLFCCFCCCRCFCCCCCCCCSSHVTGSL